MHALVRVLAALALAVAGVAFVPTPATAAYCSNNGVHVVVDFGALGGGVRTGCARTAARITADRAFPAAGFQLSYVSKYPGAVCRVSGKPASDQCVEMPPRDAYWGLFASHGGGWAYAQAGVGSTRLEPGDSVAFVWQDNGSTRRPGVDPGPAQEVPQPAPTRAAPKPRAPQPVKKTVASRPRPTSASPSASASASDGPFPSAKASSKVHAEKTARVRSSVSPAPSPTETPTETPTAATAAPQGPVATDSEPNRDGIPGWVPAGVVVALSGAAAGAFALRRKQL